MIELDNSAREGASDDSLAFAQKLRGGKPILFKPRGRSMEPHLPDGTVVMVDPVTRPLQIGEVVLSVFAGVVTMHRVVKLRANLVWLWGDAMRHGEGPLPIDSVIGIARTSPLLFVERARLSLRRIVFSLFQLFGG